MIPPEPATNCTLHDPLIQQCCCNCRHHLPVHEHCTTTDKPHEKGCVCGVQKGWACVHPEMNRVYDKWSEHSAGCECYTSLPVLPVDTQPGTLPVNAVRTTALGNYSGYIWWLPACATSTAENEWTIRSYHPLDQARPRNGWAIRLHFPR